MFNTTRKHRNISSALGSSANDLSNKIQLKLSFQVVIEIQSLDNYFLNRHDDRSNTIQYTAHTYFESKENENKTRLNWKIFSAHEKSKSILDLLFGCWNIYLKTH